MNCVKILHTADCHIGTSRSFLNDKNISGRTEIKNTFRKIISICKEENVDFLLISGDLFETPFPDFEDVEEICHLFAQIPDTIIAISAGNHDYACVGSVYLKHTFPENVRIFSSFAERFDFPEKNVCIFGAGFTDRFETLPLLSGFEAPDNSSINLCVIHGEITSESQSSNYNPISMSQIQNSGFDYIALGHIHKRTDVLKQGKTFYSYCGCPDGSGFDEDGSKGIYIGMVGKDICNLEYRELSSRMYIYESIDVSNHTSAIQTSNAILDFLTEKYSETFSKHLYRISLKGTVESDFSLNINRIRTLLEEKLTYCEITDETEPNLESIKKLAEEVSLRGIFTKILLNRLNDAAGDEAEIIHEALKLGLRAFEREVNVNDY